MGIPNSKSAYIKKDMKTDDGSLPSTPILTPKAQIIDNDPRSPSATISRTPIYSTMDDNTSGTPIVGVLHSNDEENSSINLDPRSPTVEFIRTPIVTGNLPVKLRNKTLDSVKQQTLNFNPAINESLNNSKGPKLISVTPLPKKLDKNEKRKSFVGMLETNLDFVETDIDQVAKLNNTLPNIEDKDDLFENLPNINEDVNDREAMEDEPKEKISKTETFDETELGIKTINYERPLSREELISPIKETLEKRSQIDEEVKEIITRTPVIDIDEEFESKEFDRKVTNLIYEDRNTTNIISKTFKKNNECRTPLGERNGTQHNKSPSVSNFYGKPAKKDYSVSRIPVFKEKKGKSKMAVQCENTPPRQKTNEIKPRKTQWDGDKTLII